MLIYLASMANIPNSLYESADLEGAGPLRKWWHITVPLLGGTTTFLMITGAIAALHIQHQPRKGSLPLLHNTAEIGS